MPSRLLLTLVCILAPGLAGLSLLGRPADDEKKKKPAADADDGAPLAIRGATIHPANGPRIEDGVLVVAKGKIVAVGGPDTAIPKGAKVLDGAGKHVIPGLVDTHSHIGVYGRPGVQANSDGNEGSGPVQTALRALDAVWPNDPGILMAVAGGLTCANIMPGSGNVIGGQTVYVKLRGRTVEEMRVVGDDGLLGGLKMANGENPKRFNFSRTKGAPATRMKVASLQREQFVKAREYQRKWAAYRKIAGGEKKDAKEPERDPAMDTLVEVLERKRTVHFHCHRADDLMSALRLAKEFNFEIVLQHATEGYRVAKELAERKVPVSLTLIDSPGGKPEVAGLIEENAALLTKAGVKVAINTDDPVTESRFYLRTGAIAVRGGLSELDALKALTIHPAEMMHLDRRLGSLAKGKDADFVVLSGPPFSVYTQVLQTYIDGKKLYDRDQGRDWTQFAGGLALPPRDLPRLPARPALVKPLAAAKAPALPAGAKRPAAGAKRLAVLAGRLHTVSDGTITDAVVLIEDGKITAVGPRGKVEVPKDTPTLSAAVVTPGLIDAHSSVGLAGGLGVTADQDQDETTDPNQADVRVLDGFNPDDAILAFVRSEGVTTIHTLPARGNVIAGQTGIFRTAGRSADAMTLRFPAGVLVNLGEQPKSTYAGKLPTTRMGTAALLRTAFSQARNHGKKPAADRPANAKLDALNLALTGKVPVLFSAHRADDLGTALRLAKEFDLKARLELATEGYLMLEQIVKAKVPVVVHPTMQRVGSSLETFHSQLANAAALAAKEVPIAIGTGFEAYVPRTRVLRWEAAMAAVNGLGHDAALRAITLGPAKILGLDAQRGSVTKGKVADLVLYDGDPFEHSTHVTYTIQEGRVVHDRSEYLALPFARRAMMVSGAGGESMCCLGLMK